MRFKEISLQEMFSILIDCIVNNKERPTFYYEREWELDKFDYSEITEVDLMRGRFITLDNDFSEYEWELEKSHIFLKEE